MIGKYLNDDAGKLVLRLTVGALTLFHGVGAILHPDSLASIDSALADLGLPSFLAYGIYIGEVVAPLMVILGVYSRLGGLIIAGNMVVAIALEHTDKIFSLGEHGGWALELQAFYLFCGIAVLLLGSGRLAVKPD